MAQRPLLAPGALHLRQGREQHAAGAAGGVIDALAGLGLEQLRHQVHDGVAAVVGELADQVFVGVAERVLGDLGGGEGQAGEVLQQVFERAVGQALLVGPGRVAKDAVEAPRIGGLDGTHGVLQCLANVLGDGAHLVPVGARGDPETLIGLGAGELRVVGIAGQCLCIVLVPDIRQALVEDQREDELFVVAGIDQAAQDGGGAPEVAFELREGEAVRHSCLASRPKRIRPQIDPSRTSRSRL
jgi:hypothetical protein